MPVEMDAIVVGAGPAGSAAAFYLAKNKRRVLLLDKSSFPRDKSCGDGLTQSAVRLLDEMGVLLHLPEGPKVRGARIFLRGAGYRDFLYPDGMKAPEFGLVVPRMDLDAALSQRAVSKGAELWQHADVRSLIYKDGRVAGVEVVHNGETKSLFARAVVAADGSSSRLALQAGLTGTEPTEMGFAIRGYYSGVHEITDLLEIYIPLLDATDRYLLPSYGWVFPTGPDTVNIGVGVFQRVRGANVRRMMERFVAFLLEQDKRFQNARPCGAWSGAPLRFDFAPERCMADGLLLVGDAAGLISPFTGEGISYALASGRLAAEVIHGSLRNGEPNRPDLSGYARQLAEYYSGYFEAGRHAARRYGLIWHVLENTFHSERPLFSLCRRAALFPEGIAEPVAPATVEDVTPLIHAPVFRLKNDLKTVSASLTDMVRRDWPVLAKLKPPGEHEVGILFRPALFLLLCYYLGQGRDERALLSATAVELGYLAALAHSSVSEESSNASTTSGKKANWGSLFALGVSDFLLSKAFELSARVGPPFTAAMSEALAITAEARVQEQQHAHNLEWETADQLVMIGRKVSMLFELPCRLGALCGTLPEAQIQALAHYGRELGITYYLVDDLLTLTGRGEPLGSTAGVDLEDGIYSIAIRCAARKQSEAATKLRALLATPCISADRVAEVRRQVVECGVVPEVLSLAAQSKSRAQQALRSFNQGPIRRTLWGLANCAFNRMK